MSLINEMLLDLEARRRGSSPALGTLDGLSAARWEGMSTRSSWSLGIAGLVLGVALMLASQQVHVERMVIDRSVTSAAATKTPVNRETVTVSEELPSGAQHALEVTAIAPPNVQAREPPADRKSKQRLARLGSAATKPPAKVMPHVRTSATSLAEATQFTNSMRAEAAAIHQPALTPLADGAPTVPAAIEHLGSFKREPVTAASAATTNIELARATNLLKNGARARGMQALRAYVIGHPRDDAARERYARELIKDRHLDEAAQVLARGLVANPSATRLARLLGHVYYDLGNLPAAIEALKRAQHAAARDPEYQLFLAALLQQAGTYDQAAALYRTILHATPQRGTALVGLGVSLTALQAYPEARAVFMQAANRQDLSLAVREYARSEAQRLGDQP